MGERLKNTKIDFYITSTLLRAFKTAVGVCNAKSEAPLLKLCPELIECGCTEGYYGCSKEYLDKYYDRTEELNLLSPRFGVESIEDNNLRAQAVISFIKASCGFGKTVAVFSHHGMLEYLIPTALGVKTREFSLSLENISVTEIDFEESGKRILKFLNKTDPITGV